MKTFHAPFLLVLLIFVTPSILFSQSFISANDKDDLQQISLVYSDTDLNDIKSKFPLNHMNGQTYVSFVAKANPQFDADKFRKLGCIVNPTINHLVTLKIPVNKLQIIDEFTGLSYLSLSKKMNNSLDKAVTDVRADSVHMGLGGLPEGYYGNDVIVGVTDWGFDYTSPVFYDTAMQQTRIIAAWDQYKLSGPLQRISHMELSFLTSIVFYKREVIHPIFTAIPRMELMLLQLQVVVVQELNIEELLLV